MATSSSSSQIIGGEVAPVVESISSNEVASAVSAAVRGSTPNGGVPQTVTNGAEAVVTSNSPTFGTGSRMEGFSVASLPNNTALIAFSAQDQYIYPHALSEDRIDRAIEATRIFLSASQLSSKYQSVGARRGTLIPKDENYFYLKVEPAVAEAVANTIIKDSNLNAFYFLDGPFVNTERYIEWYEAIDGEYLKFPYYGDEARLQSRDYCISYVSLFRSDAKAATPVTSMLDRITPLPFITVDGQVVPALNPQVVAQRNPGHMDGPYYAYVVAEAPVNGVYQLFLYGLRLAEVEAAVDANLSSQSSNSSSQSSDSTQSASTQSSSSPSSDSTNSSSSSSRVHNSTSSGGQSQSSESSYSSHSLSSQGNSSSSSTNSSSSMSTESSSSPSSTSSHPRSSSSSSSSSSQDRSRVSGWVQLTFVGENRNARVAMDESNTIHIVWQSSRCAPEQLYYGVMGAMSHQINNQTLISAIDKQAQLLARTDQPKITFADPIMEASSPSAMNLTQGTGRMWSKSESVTNAALVTNNSTITISGTPKSDQMIAFTSLDRDEFGFQFSDNWDWRQLSYQIAFDLNASMTGVTLLADSDVQSMYQTFLSAFTASGGTGNTTFWNNSSNTYTIGVPSRSLSMIVPLVGSYRLDGLKAALAANSATIVSNHLESAGANALSLRHFVLGLVPEQVTFLAQNTQTQAEFLTQFPMGTYASTIRQSYFTGRFRLSLLLKTNDVVEGYRVVRELGPWISVGVSTNFKIAVHYSRLPQEAMSHLASHDFAGRNLDGLRFQGDLILSINNNAVAAEAFYADFSDEYTRFDIGVGVPKDGEYRLPITTAEDGNLFSSQTTTLALTNIAIGPHSLEVNPAVAHVANLDRHTSNMLVRGNWPMSESPLLADDAGVHHEDWMVDFGTGSGRVSLTQMPITFEGINTVPSLCMDFCEQPHLAWQSNRDDRWEIYYSPSPFRYDTRITNSNSNSLSPSVTVDKDGRRLIVWHDDRSGRYQIYAATAFDTSGCYLTPCQIARADDATKLIESSSVSSDADDRSQADCAVRFAYVNTLGGTTRMHFRLSFYLDEEMTMLATRVFSRDDIANWTANGSPVDYDGVLLNPGDDAEVVCRISKTEGLADAIYWVKVEAFNGVTFFSQPEKIVYFCENALRKKCNIPVHYTNTSGATQNLRFRVTFYDSSAMTTAVYTHSTASDPRKWRAFEGVFPSGGVSVPNGQTVAVSFDPDVLPALRASLVTGQAVLCNVQYYTKVDCSVNGGAYANLSTFVFQCPCIDTDADLWGMDTSRSAWSSSGAGGNDLLVSDGSDHALFPNARASWDGLAYISWEDHRFSGVLDTAKQVVPAIMLAVYDLPNDDLYSSGQRGFDRKVSGVRRYRPQVLVDSLLNPVIFYNDRYDVYRRAISFSEARGKNYRFYYPNLFDDSSSVDIDDACLLIDVYEPDITATFYQTPVLPIRTVGKCFVRFEVQCPPDSRGVRLKNEDGEFSEWLSILPELPGDRIDADLISDTNSSESERQTLRYNFEAYFVADNKFIVPWVLSAGTGSKTVTCQVMTYAGRTRSFSVNVIASYDEFPHQIQFFADSGFTKPLPVFNGVPVASTKRIHDVPLTAENFSSITHDRDAITNVYFTVTFTDPDLMTDLYNLRLLSSFGDKGAFTFDVIRKGTADLIEQPLMREGSTWTFTGQFPINRSDGVEGMDGLAVVRVNVPDPRVKTAMAKADIVKLDSFNYMSSPLGRYASLFPDKPFTLAAEDIRSVDVSRANASIITLDTFRELYRPELACTFLGRSCNGGAQPDDDLSSSSTSLMLTESAGSSNPVEPNCGSFNWEVRITSEPGYWSYQENPNVFMRYSDPVVLDLSSPYVVGVRFGDDTINDGILLMIHDGDVVTQTWSGVSGADVAFACPSDTIVFGCQPTPAPYIHGPTLYHAASAKKTFTVSGVDGSEVIIPQGTPLNDETGDVSLFNGKPGWTKYDNFFGISLDVLKSLGYIDINGQFRCKFVHIVSGVGFVKFNFTCNTIFDLSSSSSYSSASPGPAQSESSEVCALNIPLWPFGATASPRNLCQTTSYTLYTLYDISGGIPTEFMPSSSSSSSSSFSAPCDCSLLQPPAGILVLTASGFTGGDSLCPGANGMFTLISDGMGGWHDADNKWFLSCAGATWTLLYTDGVSGHYRYFNAMYCISPCGSIFAAGLGDCSPTGMVTISCDIPSSSTTSGTSASSHSSESSSNTQSSKSSDSSSHSSQSGSSLSSPSSNSSLSSNSSSSSSSLGAHRYTAYNTGEITTAHTDCPTDNHWTVDSLPAKISRTTDHGLGYSWPPNGSDYAWISYGCDMWNPSTTTVIKFYITTLHIPSSENLATLTVQFNVRVDDVLDDIIVNGTSTGLTMSTSMFTAFTLTQANGLIHGDNIIQFKVRNYALTTEENPTGITVVWTND